MFAGPNGSGKSTLKTVLRRELLGVYLNPDELERDMGTNGVLHLGEYGVETTEPEAKAFFRESAFLQEAGFADVAERVSVSERRLIFGREAVNSYVASVTADFLRRRLLAARASFTLETVMSHPGKVALLEQAQRLGYRTYLYLHSRAIANLRLGGKRAHRHFPHFRFRNKSVCPNTLMAKGHCHSREPRSPLIVFRSSGCGRN